MEQEHDKVYQYFNENPAFSGIAMHHYDSLRDLPSSWGPVRVLWTPPADTIAPTAISSALKAKVFNYQRIDLSFGMAINNTEVGQYNIYRSTQKNFTPGPSNLVASVRGLTYTDKGLLPSTTYYYKVAPEDTAHNIGPFSVETSATTKGTTLKPMIIGENNISYNNNYHVAEFQLRVIDREMGQPISDAVVNGRFTFGAGKYINAHTNSIGIATGHSESVDSSYQVGFQPDRILANGYYWAQAYDQSHTSVMNTIGNK